jgi:hypothetical protein
MSHWQRLKIKMTAMGTKQLARNSEMSISFGSLSAAELGDLGSSHGMTYIVRFRLNTGDTQ